MDKKIIMNELAATLLNLSHCSVDTYSDYFFLYYSIKFKLVWLVVFDVNHIYSIYWPKNNDTELYCIAPQMELNQ